MTNRPNTIFDVLGAVLGLACMLMPLALALFGLLALVKYVLS
jgi:hypothetical protein